MKLAPFCQEVSSAERKPRKKPKTGDLQIGSDTSQSKGRFRSSLALKGKAWRALSPGDEKKT
jgi:hypothetical protein